MNKRKLLKKILGGSKNIQFDEFVGLLKAFGFRHARTTGSHYIFQHARIRELINIQDFKGKVKPYQIKQLLDLVEQYNLQLGD